MSEGFTVTGCGDAALTRRMSSTADESLKTLVSDADAALVNLEAPILTNESMPAAFNNGLYLQSPPWSLDDLSEFGFNLFAAASNHSGDYLQDGMHRTIEALEERNLTYAGIGTNITDARSPGYLQTPNGRVALVAVTSTLKRGIHAGPAGRGQEARPGVAPLRTRTAYRVTDEEFEALQEISERLGLEDLKSSLDVPEANGRSMLLMDVDSGNSIPFVRADETGVDRKLVPDDVRPILEQIKQAQKRADHVIVSVHTHQGAGAGFNDHSVPDFLESFAHDCVRIGADAVMCHGPHVLRGIEIFGGAPIFYSLGNFALQFETTDRFPAEMYGKHGMDKEASSVELVEEVMGGSNNPDVLVDMRKTMQSVLPVCRFGESLSITLHPIDLGVDEDSYNRGDPTLADADVADEILSDLERLSEPYGTTIERVDDRGRIHA